MIRRSRLAAVLGLVLCTVAILCGASAEAPKRGGTLTYMIPADAPPSFDGHRETTYATLHAVAPFYSVLIKVNPENPSSTTDFVCDLCSEIPKPTDSGKTYTFKVQAPDPTTIVFRLKFATDAFLPALADPYAFIYKKEILDKDPHWYEKNILGSGPFKFEGYEIGQSIKGVRNPDYYHEGQPYLDGFIGIFAAKQAVRVDAIRADRAALEFRGLPPSARDELVHELGDKITVQTSDWNCGNLVTPNHQKKPFDDPRVRRALALAVDAWHGAPALAKIATVHTVAGIVFPGSPLAASKEELQTLAGFWPDIGKSREEAKRLLKEAGAEGLEFELMNRNVDQPYKYVATWLIDEWSKVGLQVTQRVLPTGPFFDALRHGTFDVTVDFNCQSVVNPLLDIGKFLPQSVYAENYGGYDDQKEIELYQAILHETDASKQRAMIGEFEKYVLDTQAHMLMTPWWYRIIPMRSYVKG